MRGLKVQDLCLKFRSLGFRVQGLGLNLKSRIQSLGYGVQRSAFNVSGYSGFEVWGLGFGILGWGSPEIARPSSRSRPVGWWGSGFRICS